jgi:hypothetical protein
LVADRPVSGSPRVPNVPDRQVVERALGEIELGDPIRIQRAVDARRSYSRSSSSSSSSSRSRSRSRSRSLDSWAELIANANRSSAQRFHVRQLQYLVAVAISLVFTRRLLGAIFRTRERWVISSAANADGAPVCRPMPPLLGDFCGVMPPPDLCRVMPPPVCGVMPPPARGT